MIFSIFFFKLETSKSELEKITQAFYLAELAF
jgi:hypothetical protein